MSEQRVDLTCSKCREMNRGTYELPVACSNCGFTGWGVYSKSHDARDDKCPTCETSNLRPMRGKLQVRA